MSRKSQSSARFSSHMDRASVAAPSHLLQSNPGEAHVHPFIWVATNPTSPSLPAFLKGIHELRSCQTFTAWFSLAEADHWLCTFTRRHSSTHMEKATVSIKVSSWLIVTEKVQLYSSWFNFSLCCMRGAFPLLPLIIEANQAIVSCFFFLLKCCRCLFKKKKVSFDYLVLRYYKGSYLEPNTYKSGL